MSRQLHAIYLAHLSVFLLAGCASGPTWVHPQIADKTAAARQLTIDDGYCTLVSEGGAPSPIIPPPNPSSFSVKTQGDTYNTTTGQRTYSTYSSQVNSGNASDAFNSGLASGANLGAVIAASQARGKIYKSCMYSKGWSDTPIPTSVNPIRRDDAATTTRQPMSPKRVYLSAQDEWVADTQEFLRFFPAYASGVFYDRLNQRVKALAKTQDMSGPEYLMAAHNQLKKEGLAAPEDSEDSGGARSIYTGAVMGYASDQAGLGLFYSGGRDSRTPTNPQRSAHWSRLAALKENSVGQVGYAIALFSGIGVTQDKINAYLWAKQAEVKERGRVNGENVKRILSNFESQMSEDELKAVK